MQDPFLFVSHVSEDRPAALEIVDELERRGVPCWIAPRNVRPGRPFDDAIVEAIEASRAMLLIFSEHCNEHEYIRREITVAGESDKIIIPFRIENARPRRGLRMRLSDLQWIDGFVSREQAIDQVIRTIDPDRAWQQEVERQRAEDQQRADEQRRGQEEERRRQTLSQAQVPSPVPQVSATEALKKGDNAFAQKNIAEAMRWYREAADQGNAVAQNKLAWIYQNGRGVGQDYAEAMQWYRKAADQGDAVAQNNIGILYQYGHGVAQDYAEAMRWYRKAADQGDASAQKNIGMLYQYGHGVAQDYAEAMRWYRKAADQGHSFAQKNIERLKGQ